MMDVRAYYHDGFRDRLNRFMSDRATPYFGRNWRVNCDDLTCIPHEERAAFLVCLYFTVLADQGMYCYYRPYYQTFEALTRYPKFCHGLLTTNHNPKGILNLPVKHGLVREPDLLEILPDGMQLFAAEVNSFFREYFPNLSPWNFFEKLRCDPDLQAVEMWAVLNPEVTETVDYVAYREMVKATNPLY